MVAGVSKDFQDKVSISKKLIFAGLSDAGKTSISRTLKNDITGTALVKPTYLVDRSVFKYLDYEIIQHDMGGQKKYLINYLKEPGNYFDKTDVCVYVIDILDDKRFGESVEYFKNMLERYEQIGLDPRIWVLFHKAEKYLFDGDAAALTTITALRQKILDVSPKKFKIAFEISSIYDKWCLSRIFTRIFQDLYPRSDLVVELLKTIAGTIKASAAVLIDDQLLPIAEYPADKAMDGIVKATAPYLYKIEEELETLQPTWKRWLKLEANDLDIMYYEIPQEEGKKRLHLYLIGKLGSISSTAVLLKIGPRLGELLQALYAQ